MNEKNIWPVIRTALLIIAAALLLMMWVSCNPAKKAERKMEAAKKLLDGNIIQAAKFCAEKFPPITEFLPGDTVINYDTLWGLKIDTLNRTFIIDNTDTLYKLVPKLVTKTIRITDTLRYENRARIIAFQADINDKITELSKEKYKNEQLQKEVEIWKQKAKKRFNLWFIIAALVGWNFRKQIVGIAGKFF